MPTCRNHGAVCAEAECYCPPSAEKAVALPSFMTKSRLQDIEALAHAALKEPPPQHPPDGLERFRLSFYRRVVALIPELLAEIELQRAECARLKKIILENSGFTPVQIQSMLGDIS